MLDIEIQPQTYKAIEQARPALVKWHEQLGVTDPQDTALHTQIRNPINCVFTAPLISAHTCEAILAEAQKHTFTPNAQEDTLRQMPEVILRDVDFDWYEQMLGFADEYLNPLFESTIGRRVETGTIQIAIFLFMIVPYKIIYHCLYNKCHLVKRWRVFSLPNQPAKENCATFSCRVFF